MMVSKNNLVGNTDKHCKEIDGVRFLDLVVEMYNFPGHIQKTSYDARMEGARMAEKILYKDIYDTLLSDVGGAHPRRPHPKFSPESLLNQIEKDRFAKWKISEGPGFMIPPEAYFRGIDWIPYDENQKFKVKVVSREIEIMKAKGYRGVVQIDAFVLDDGYSGNGNRLGCLVDVIHKNVVNDNIADGTTYSLIGGRIPVPMGGPHVPTFIENLRNVSLMVGKLPGDYFLEGFKGLQEKRINFHPINLQERKKMGEDRDRFFNSLRLNIK